MADLEWRISPWDHHLHAFRSFGEVVSEALCEHSARTSALTEGEARRCLACLFLHGSELADRQGDSRWAG